MARLLVGDLQLELDDVRVHRQVVVAGVDAHRRHDALGLLGGVAAAHEVARHERARVDHRVVGPVVALVEDDRVERVAARLDPDVAQDLLAPVVLERQRVREDLRDRLQREERLLVAGPEEHAVDRRQADAETVGELVAGLAGAEAPAPGS